MRIGIDARFYGSLGKGLGRYTERLISGLERLDGENEYFIFLRRANFAEYRPERANFHPVLADFPWYGWREQVLFPRLLRRSRIDLMHFPHFNVPFFYRRPFVVTIHDLILLRFPTIKATELSPFLYWLKYVVYRAVIASAISRARAVLTVSQFTARDLGQHYPKALSKVVVTPEAADPVCYYVLSEERTMFLQKLGLVRGESGERTCRPFVLYVGNAYPHKNLDFMLRMAGRLPQFLFVLVGKEDYFYRLLKERARAQKLKNVIFAGFVSDRLLSVLYREARLYFFPSLYEGFGLPALEAALYGLPVLASKRGSLPEVLGEGAVFFDPDHEEECQDLLVALMTDEKQRQILREAGHKRSSRFDWQTLVERTHALYLADSTQELPKP